MKDIEKLVAAAHNDDWTAFEKEWSLFRTAVFSIGESSRGRSSDEKSLFFICGCLNARPSDLRAVAKMLWKHEVSKNWENGLEGEKNARNDLASILLSATRETVEDLIDDFKVEVQPTSAHPDGPSKIVASVLIHWIVQQTWNNDDLLKRLIQNNQIKPENMVYHAVSVGNAGVIETLMQISDEKTRQRIALFVAGNWSQNIVERNKPEEYQIKYNDFHPMFAAIADSLDLDGLIDCGLLERNKAKEGVDIGAMYWPINSAFTWDGDQATIGRTYKSQYAQFNMLLAHITLPSATRHVETLEKMYRMCPEELPRLQEWFNHMQNVQLRSHIDTPSITGKKRM